MTLARTKDRMVDLQRRLAVAKTHGTEAYVVTPAEIKKLCPLINTEDLAGGIYAPSDGKVMGPDVALVFAELAKQNGVKVFEGVRVDRVLTKNKSPRVSSVETSHGTIQCEYFVNCAGQWARELGKRSEPKVPVPLHSCEHFNIVTKPIEGLDSMLPGIYDYDGMIYIRELNGGLLAGGFEPVAKPVFRREIPKKFEFQLFTEDWDHFQILFNEILHRLPLMHDAKVRQLINGPESFTPDDRLILGESDTISNYFVAAGMNSRGIVLGGGVGKYMAEWIIDRKPSIDLWADDIHRFVSLHNNKQFLGQRVKEIVGRIYSLPYPLVEYTTGRKLRTSALHTRLEGLGAYFGETMAYERAMWFSPQNEGMVDEVVYVPTWGKPSWFESVQEEYRACKERVCLIDMSSFAKFEIKSTGQGALEYLQYLCSNDIDQDIGTVVHTGMQNETGGFENDCSIARLQDNYFFMICPATQQTRASFWLRQHLPEDGSVQVRDVTSMYSGINLIGPHAQQLLGDVTDISTDRSDFKVMTCKEIDVGCASGVRAMRLTHTGEDGFILYIPAEYALHTYDTLIRAGKDYGVSNAGYFAMRHLRTEQFFAYWGLDLNSRTTPMECGREFRVKLDKGDFIGRNALQQQKTHGIHQKFVQFLLDDFDVHGDLWPWGGEPIYRNGKYVGLTTTCSYGFTLDQMVCLGYVSDFDEDGKPQLKKYMNKWVMEKDAQYEIDIAGRKYTAKAGIYTPKLAMSSFEASFIPVPVQQK
ncbi:pyruvate dehydrogenase phosphatase regulatory subunit, mitochondrial-like isoform X2 [Gigantopelta aegis]|nr:pyruvate dehydrogenase phosphatase regulatory subunit, mitochondrial-like isoform X2 [Gigantopelta aegis]